MQRHAIENFDLSFGRVSGGTRTTSSGAQHERSDAKRTCQDQRRNQNGNTTVASTEIEIKTTQSPTPNRNQNGNNKVVNAETEMENNKVVPQKPDEVTKSQVQFLKIANS